MGPRPHVLTTTVTRPCMCVRGEGTRSRTEISGFETRDANRYTIPPLIDFSKTLGLNWNIVVDDGINAHSELDGEGNPT